jgi:radical SAM protein with 4Fe4S-binding SPASM domain
MNAPVQGKKRSLPILGPDGSGATIALSALRDRARERAIPFHAQLYIEHRCHLKCQHCFEDEETHPTNDRLSLAEIERVLTELASLGCLQLTITGGEIFLRKDVFEILAIAKRLRFQTTLFTSGTLITREKAAKLKELAVGQVDISLYSDLAADHDAFTQVPGSWQKSTDALRYLRELDVHAALKCVLTTFNVDRIDNVIALAHALDVPFQLDPNVRPRMSNDRSTLQFALDAKTLADKVFSRRDLNPAFRNFAPDRVCRGSDFLHGSNAMCGAGSSTLAISATGDVLPCGFFPAAVGSIRTHSLTEIWQRSATLQDMRQMTYEKMSSCPTCDVRSACHPCMAYGQVEHGDYKECNTASRTSAEALILVADRAQRNNRKFELSGRALPIVGETHLPEATGTAAAVLTMFD